MKRKFLATLMAVFMVVGMVGCGDAGASEQYSNNTPSPSFIAPSSSAETAPSSYDESDNVDDPAERDVGTSAESEEAVSNEVEVASTSVPQVGTTLFLCDENYRSVGSGRYNSYDIYKVDLSAGGAFQLWASFILKADLSKGIGDVHYSKISKSYIRYSRDFLRRAVDKNLPSGEVHAGWLCADETYYDVIELNGIGSTNDFDLPKHFSSIGFTDDDLFVFEDLDNEVSYYVSINDPTDIHEGNPIEEEFGQILSDYARGITFSDYYDEQHYLATMSRGSYDDIYFVDVDLTGKLSDIPSLIAGGVRENWDAVFSPDKGSVAFLSVSKDFLATDVALYITDIDGTAPQKVENVELDIQNWFSYYLLDWQ